MTRRDIEALVQAAGMTAEEISARVEAAVAAQIARHQTDRDATLREEQALREADAAAWRDAVGPTIVACGVRPLLVDGVLQRAAQLFELRDGEVRPRASVMHPRDPVKDYDPVTWLADLHAGPDGELIFGNAARND